MRTTKVKVVVLPPKSPAQAVVDMDVDLFRELVYHLEEYGYKLCRSNCCSVGKKAADLYDAGVIVEGIHFNV